ncbi:MAG: hypothetical protein HQM09_22175 [Candidatus Riflebacteria bacterium]|nr:hypothetical protein [Candidatus Riflebacteria bacterium]
MSQNLELVELREILLRQLSGPGSPAPEDFENLFRLFRECLASPGEINFAKLPPQLIDRIIIEARQVFLGCLFHLSSIPGKSELEQLKDRFDQLMHSWRHLEDEKHDLQSQLNITEADMPRLRSEVETLKSFAELQNLRESIQKELPDRESYIKVLRESESRIPLKVKELRNIDKQIIKLITEEKELLKGEFFHQDNLIRNAENNAK